MAKKRIILPIGWEPLEIDYYKLKKPPRKRTARAATEEKITTITTTRQVPGLRIDSSISSKDNVGEASIQIWCSIPGLLEEFVEKFNSFKSKLFGNWDIHRIVSGNDLYLEGRTMYENAGKLLEKDVSTIELTLGTLYTSKKHLLLRNETKKKFEDWSELPDSYKSSIADALTKYGSIVVRDEDGKDRELSYSFYSKAARFQLEALKRRKINLIESSDINPKRSLIKLMEIDPLLVESIIGSVDVFYPIQYPTSEKIRNFVNSMSDSLAADVLRFVRETLATKTADLKEYWEKRDFTKTPEPRGSIKKTDPQHKRFLINKHHTERRGDSHFDLRLESEGVLKSFAIPKGRMPKVSGEKLLIVPTEDHPVEYLDESLYPMEIPSGEYGAGTIYLEDKGEYELKEGDLNGPSFFD